MRIVAILFFYTLACTAIYTATNIAPHMTWPNNPNELGAAAMLVIGMFSKCIGHWLLGVKPW